MIYNRRICSEIERLIQYVSSDEKELPIDMTLRTIRERERRLAAGVGNAPIADVVKELWKEALYLQGKNDSHKLTKEAAKTLFDEFTGSIKRDIDERTERLGALDEKYNAPPQSQQ